MPLIRCTLTLAEPGVPVSVGPWSMPGPPLPDERATALLVKLRARGEGVARETRRSEASMALDGGLRVVVR